jgi:glutathione S-transferase
MSLIFYYVPMSTSSITEAVLAELDIPCDRIQLSITDGDTKQPDFLNINPNGRVPAIVHDGTAIWESAAITMYLGEVFGVAAQLYPPLGTQRGEAMKWIVWGNVTLAEAGGRLSALLPSDSDGGVVPNSKDWIPPEQRSTLALAKAQADLVSCLGILDRALAGKSFLLGDYSLVDTHLQGFVGWIGSMDVALEPFPNVMGWLGRCCARPAIAKLMEES